MKRLPVLIFITCFSIASHAAEYLDGYIIMANNDTVKCRFKANGFIRSTSFNRLAVTNEQGEEKVFNTRDKQLLGYGFVEKGRRYDFLYVDAKLKTDRGFYQRIIDGSKYKLYVHMLGSVGPGFNVAQTQYVLYNSSGQFEKFETCLACPWRRHLRELLANDATALESLETASRLDIPKFVMQINKG